MKTLYPTTNQSPRIISFNGLRSLATLMVLMGHALFVASINTNINLGANAVSIFIMLSGFCISILHLNDYPTLKHPFKISIQFAFSRIKKFYPLYFITFLSFCFHASKTNSSS